MIRTMTKAKTKQDRSLLSKAQQMLADSRTKVEVLKMRILKLRSDSAQQSAGDADERKKNLANSPEGRIALLRYRVDVETRLLQGARSIIKAQTDKKADKKNVEVVSVATMSCKESCVVYSMGFSSRREVSSFSEDRCLYMQASMA